MNLPAVRKMVSVACVTVFLAGGCATHHAPAPDTDRALAPPVSPVVASNVEIEVAGQPPVAVAENIPPNPDNDSVWIAGAWDWRGRWVWVKGRWEHPPHPGAVWVSNRYQHHGGKYAFIRGGWK